MGSSKGVPALITNPFSDMDDHRRETVNMNRHIGRYFNDTRTDITDGYAVSLDVSGTDYGTELLGASCELCGVADDPLGIGVADQDIPQGEWGDVVQYGLKHDAYVLYVKGIAIGDPLQFSATAGALEVGGADTQKIAAVLIGPTIPDEQCDVGDIYLFCM